jgi:predicted metalloprotease with PDZ domain
MFVAIFHRYISFMSKRHYFAAAVFLLFSIASRAQNGTAFKGYRFSMDLTNIKNDQIRVDLKPPAISKKTITYQLPKIVPGTYSIDDYGRYVEAFKAYNKKGDTLQVVRKDVNSWVISDADKLTSLSYLVNDSYDDFVTKQTIFEPAGSDIQKDTVYAINNHCFLGYFDDMKNVPYELTIVHPANMYGTTALTDLDKSPTTDRFITESYNRIVDNPFLYDVPDTTVIKVGNSTVLISVYSPNKLITSGFLAKKLDTLLTAQTKYLGGKLPVEKYAFIIYLDDKPGPSGHVGALEHSYSSFYYLGETDSLQLSHFVLDASAHEFFHIITPLSIHSEEIQNFDFSNPKMSEHLWLYEGSTEYHAHMVQEKYGMITSRQLLNTLSSMITTSRTRYNDTLPFTALSKGALTQYKDQYENVYQKGALIAFCIDVKLLQLSNGKYGFMNMMQDLAARYGKQKGFKDEELFDVIGKITYPEIEDFLKTYVSGNKPLPLEQVFASLGVNYQAIVETKDSSFTLGRIGFGFNPATSRVIVAETSNMNAFGKAMGYHKNDEIISINGQEINQQTAGKFFRNFQTAYKVGDELIIKVNRKDENGKDTVVELKSVMAKFPVTKFNVLNFAESPTAEQLKLRDYWLKPNGIQVN